MIFGAISDGGNKDETINTIDTTPREKRINLDDIDTSHPDYYNIWWKEARNYKFNWLPPINYSERAIAWCKETDAYPISIGEHPLYCSDGRSGTWKE